MMCLRRLFGFSLILFIIQVDGVQIGAKPPLLVCHVPLELKIFADSSYQASSADLKSCTLIVLSSVNILFLTSSNASLASVVVSEKRSLQLLKQQTPEAAFSFSLRSTNTFPAIRHLRTIFNDTTSVAHLIEFLKVNKLTSFDIAWDLIQSTPDYVPKLKTLKTALAKEGFNLTTTIGVEVYNTDALHVSKIAAIVDHIFLVPSYNRHYSGAQYPLADKKLEQAFDTLELNEGVFLKLYSTLNLSWRKIVVGLSLQTLVWKLNGGTTVVGTQFNQNQAILHLQNYYESCKNVNSTWRLRQQANPFYKLAVAPTNDQWMIHVDPFTLARRVDLIRQYGFGGVALYDYYQDDFAGVCNANGKVYPLIHQAGLSIFNNSIATPFPDIDPNGGLCIPFLGLTSECKGIFNFGTSKLNISSSSIGSTSSTTSSSVTATKITVPVENNPTTTRTSSAYSSENNVTTPSSSPSTTVTTALPVSRGARMSDAENVVRLRRSSVSSEGTEPSFSYVNSPGLASTDLDFPSTLNSEIKLPAAESLVTTSVSVNAAIEAFLTKVEPWRDDQTRLSGVTETSALNQTDDSNVTFDQDRQQPTLPNTVIDAVPTTSLPLKKSKAVTVKQALTNETERATDFAIVPTIPSVAAEVTQLIQVETEPTSTNDFKGLKSIDEITTKSASLHESFTEITSLAVTEGDTQKFTGQKSTDEMATDVTNPVNEKTTSKFPSLSSDAQQDWTPQIPLSAAFEILPTAIKMESLNVALTTEQPPKDDAFSSEKTSASGYQGTVPTVPPSSLSSEQFTISEFSSVPAEMATESNPLSEGFTSTIKSIASPTDLVSATQDTGELSTERFSRISSMALAPIDETQSSTDYLTSPKVPMDEDFSKKTDYDPTTAIDSIDKYYSIEHEDNVSTVSSQKYHSTNEDFSTTNAEILETENSIASDRLSPSTRIPTIMESSTETEHYLFSSSSVVKMSTESNPVFEGFPSTIKTIASPTDLVSATQDTGELSTERFNLVASSMAPIDEAQSSTDFYLTSPKVLIDEDFSKTDYDPMSTAAIDSIGTYYSTEYQDTVSTVSSQKFSNDHSTKEDFSTANAEILETETSIASDRLSPTTGISSIMESSTETEHYFSSSSPSLVVSSESIQSVEPSKDNFSSESSLAYSSSPYYFKTDIPKEVDDVPTFASQYPSSEQFPVSELLSFDSATSTEGSLSSDLFSPTFELIIPVGQVSSSTFFNPNIIDSSIHEQFLESSSPNSPTSISEETDIGLSTSPIPPDASTEDTQLLSNENGSSTTNFFLENSESEITSPQPEGSTIQQSVEETSPTEPTFYSTSFGLDTSLTHTSDISTEDQDAEVSTLSPQGSSHQRLMEISELSTELAETSPQDSRFEPTLLPNLVDTASTFIIPDMVESSTENLHTIGNLDVSSEELKSQDSNLSTSDFPIIVDISTVDSQLLNSEIYPTTIAFLVDLPNEETVSSSLPFVTDENDGDDNAPLIDTLKPTDNEFASPREEGLFSSVEADFSTSSYVSHKQTLSPVQSSSLVTTDSAVSTTFPPIDTSTEMNDASTSFDLFISATNSPHFSEFEIGSGEESNDVSTLAPIFENEGSGEDVTSTLEENITPGFLNATEEPETSTSEIDSTVSLLTSSIADSVSEASTRHDVTTAFSVEYTSPKVVEDVPFVQQLEANSSTKLATISTEIFVTSTSPTFNDIPSTEVSVGNTFLPTHPTDNDESESKSSLPVTFSSSSTSLSTQSFIVEVVTGSSVLSSDYNNKITNSTGAWSDTSSESPFAASTSTDSTSSTFTTNVASSNTSPNSTSTKEWIDVSAVTIEVPSITVSSSNFTALSPTSSSTTSHSTSSSLSSTEPTSITAVKSISIASSLRTTTFSPPHSEIPTTEIPLVGLWNLLISKLNLTNGFPFSGEYSFTSNFFSSNATSSSLGSEESENMKETLSSITSNPNENTVPAGNLLFETRPYWLINRPNTEEKETNRPPQPVSRTTSTISFANLFETRPYWLQGITKPTNLALSSTSTLPTSRESSITSSTKGRRFSVIHSRTILTSNEFSALHTSASELRPSRTTETPSSTSLSAQSVTRSPCTENCTEESTQQATDSKDSSVVLVAKDVANNVVVHLNVNAYMDNKKLNSSFNFEKWLEDLNRFLSSPSTSTKPHTDQEIQPSPMCEVAGNSILLKSLFCSNESLSTAEKMRFHNLMNLTRRLAPAIIANLTTAMNLTEVAQTVNEIELLSHQPNAINETSTESVVSLSTESSTAKSTVIEQQNSTSFFDSQNGLTTLVSSNLSDVPLPTVLNGSLESFMLNLTELLKDAQINDLISAVNQLNHAIPEGFLENLIRSNHSEDAELFNQSAAGNDVKNAVTTQVPTSTLPATAPVEYDIFQKNFWITNRRNPVRKLQRVAGPGLGILPSIRIPLRTTAKPVSNIFSFLAKPAARRQ